MAARVRVQGDEKIGKQVREREQRGVGLLILFAQQEERGHSGKLTTGAMPQPLWPREEDDRACFFFFFFSLFFCLLKPAASRDLIEALKLFQKILRIFE